MDDIDKEIAKLEHALAQLERGTYKEAAGPRGIDVLAVTKAGFRRRIAGLKQRQGSWVPSDRGGQVAEHTIMVVEDELLLRLDLANQIHSAGFEVIEAQSADEALKLLATDIDVDLILTDIRMPGQIDGLGLVSFVQRQDRRIKIVLLSAYIDADCDSPADASFAKPVRIQALLGKIRELLARNEQVNPPGP
jgi:CheY-like chemotaxis protein